MRSSAVGPDRAVDRSSAPPPRSCQPLCLPRGYGRDRLWWHSEHRGGFGSGGRNATGAATCESCLSIDLAWLRRRGMLQPGRYSSLTWSRAGEQTGSITLIAQHDGVRLRYQTKDREGRRSTSTSSSPSLTRPPGSAAAGNGSVA